MPKPRLSWIDVAWIGNPEKVVGFAVSVRGLSPASSLRLQTLGLGGRRHLGCGLLLPTAARELQGASEL
nr:type I-MYXAN CRISPR-associated protein Cas6/Cmx6 [Cystobacter ferrugineus]